MHANKGEIVHVDQNICGKVCAGNRIIIMCQIE